MDKYVVRTEPCGNDAAIVAEFIERDFTKLIMIYDYRLSRVSDAEFELRSEIVVGRETAQRGLELSRHLLDFLRSRA